MPKLKITSAMELEMLVQQMGFLPFFSCSIPSFSIEEFTPSRYWFVDGVDGPWEWRMELARRGVVAYGKLFSISSSIALVIFGFGMAGILLHGGVFLIIAHLIRQVEG